MEKIDQSRLKADSEEGVVLWDLMQTFVDTVNKKLIDLITRISTLLFRIVK